MLVVELEFYHHLSLASNSCFSDANPYQRDMSLSMQTYVYNMLLSADMFLFFFLALHTRDISKYVASKVLIFLV